MADLPEQDEQVGLEPFHTNGTSGGKFDLLLIRRGHEASVFTDSLAQMPVTFPTCIGLELKDGRPHAQHHRGHRPDGAVPPRLGLRPDLLFAGGRAGRQAHRLHLAGDPVQLRRVPLQARGGGAADHVRLLVVAAARLRDYVASKFIASSIFQAKARAIDRARILAAQNGRALSARARNGRAQAGHNARRAAHAWAHGVLAT